MAGCYFEIKPCVHEREKRGMQVQFSVLCGYTCILLYTTIKYTYIHACAQKLVHSGNRFQTGK